MSTISPDKTSNALTRSQRQAVEARGNVLVMAGAGTGKTKTLVARCLDCLARERVSLDELLIVTFTEAAAAELRQRLRRELEKQSAAEPGDEHWPRQLVVFDLAHIGTLHSFCLRLIREHFYELGLDPQFAILDEGEARQRADETLDEQFHAHYEGEDAFSLAVQNLIQVHGSGRDENIRKLILRLHHYSQTRPDAASWLVEQIEKFSNNEPTEWLSWLLQVIAGWRNEWLPVLENLSDENEKAVELAGILRQLPKAASRKMGAEILERIAAADLTASYPKGRAGKLRPALGKIFEEAAFLLSLAAAKNDGDPLAEDWSWVRGHMETLLRLAREFAESFSQRKLADGVLDFHDLEQFALKLLWDFSTGKPAPAAEIWRGKLKFIFVDEYQDINAAQDKIIQALSREPLGVPPSGGSGGPPEGGTPNPGNRFLVGDVKQSIYRFRLADPKIFRDYARDWLGKAGQTIPLSENFRSRENLLNFVNSVCQMVMREEIGGIAYDESARLEFGSPPTRTDFSAAKDSAPRAELLLRRKTGRDETPDDENSDLADLDEAQKEARLVAARLKQFVADQTKIWDDHKSEFRAAEWRDVAILLRSPRGKSEIFAKEFERAGIPLAVARGGFYESSEILDLLSLLELLDNPLQDVPCIAVLRSPLVGLSLDELAEIRLAAKEKHFWTALNHFGKAESGKRKAETAAKISEFLERFARWRKTAKQVSLSQCLEEILAETLYADWLQAQPRGTQRAANIAGFLNLAQSFDQFQRQGLFRFLKFIKAQQAAEVEPEVPANASENAVRLMSIHQSKGLEFPIVVLADLAKPFNEQDLRGEIIFDEEFGLCPKVKPPMSGRRYPSLPHWLAQRRQKRELRGEELRLLYVGLTRARDNLILAASTTEKNWDEAWTQPHPVTTRDIAETRSFAGWLALWFAQNAAEAGATSGETPLLRWRFSDDIDLEKKSSGNQTDAAQAEIGHQQPTAPERERGGSAIGDESVNSSDFAKLRTMLSWNYPFTAATNRKAKSSVTALRREADELDNEAEQVFPPQNLSLRKMARGKLSASEIGAAHHKFLQRVALERTGEIVAEADRLARENYLSADERAALDLDALEQFWNSRLGQKISKLGENVRRELPFTVGLSPAEVAEITGGKVPDGLENEFVVVQGVADLVVLQPAEIWLVDFKTDDVGPDGLAGKIKTYAPQLKLYAVALEKIFNRKVTLRALHFFVLRRTEEV